MTLGNDRIKKKLDDIDGKIDLMMGYCQSLQQENKTQLLKICILEAELGEKRNFETVRSKQETLIQSKIERLLAKLNTFSNSLNITESSDL